MRFRRSKAGIRCSANAALFLLMIGEVVLGQTAGVDRLERELDLQNREQYQQVDNGVPLDRRALFDGGLFLTSDYISADDQFHDNHGVREYTAVGFGRFNLDDVYELYARASTTYRDFNPGDSFDGFGSRLIDPDFDRAYFRFDSGKYEEAYHGFTPAVRLVAQVGRDLAFWGNGLVISQVLDGGKLKLAMPAFDLDTFVGITPTRTIDFDPSRPAFDYDTRRLFYGVMASKQIGTQRPFVYAIAQNDLNRDQVVALPENGVARFNYNSYYIGMGTQGNVNDKLELGTEIAFEGGYGLSNGSDFPPSNGFAPSTQIPQRNDAIAAGAADIQLDYLPDDANHSRLGAEVIVASGDPDRKNTDETLGGNSPGTVDQAFNAFGQLNTGLAFSPAVSNICVGRMGASTFPLPTSDLLRRFQLGVDVFSYYKLRSRGGFDEATGSNAYLGSEPDIFINWQITSDVTFAARYGVFFPSSSIQSSDNARQFIYMGLTYAL